MQRSAFLAGTAAAFATSPRIALGATAGAASVSFEGRTSVPVVRVRAGTRDLLVAIDTANPQTTLGERAVDALKFSGTSLSALTIATGVTLRGIPAAAGDLADWNAATGFAVDVALGYEAFRDRGVTVDYRNGRLRFPDVAPDGETAPLTWLTYDGHAPKLITFDGLSFDGFPVAAQWDTGMTKTAVIFETKVPDLAIDNAPKGSPQYTYAGEPLRAGRVGSAKIGSTTLLTRVNVFAADAQARVPTTAIGAIAGNALFARTAVTLDIPNGQLIVG